MKCPLTHSIPITVLVLLNAGCGIVGQNQDCLEEGALYSYKHNPDLLKQPCCKGLSSVQIDSGYNSETNQCDSAPPGWYQCLSCGDSICNQDVEEPCNCPNDCALPSS